MHGNRESNLQCSTSCRNAYLNNRTQLLNIFKIEFARHLIRYGNNRPNSAVCSLSYFSERCTMEASQEGVAWLNLQAQANCKINSRLRLAESFLHTSLASLYGVQPGTPCAYACYRVDCSHIPQLQCVLDSQQRSYVHWLCAEFFAFDCKTRNQLCG